MTRSCASAAHAQASIASGWRPGRARRARTASGPPRPPSRSAREQPELDAEVDQPRAVEPAEAGDQVVEAVVERHRRADCRMRDRRDRVRAAVPYGARGPMQRFARGAGFWGSMDTDSRLIAALGRRPRRGRSRRSCWPTRTGSTRSPCACSATRATPRRPPRTRSSAPTARSPAYDADADPRAPAPAVAGDDRPQPVPLAADPAAGRRPAVRCRSTSTRRRAMLEPSHRRGAGPVADERERRAARERLGRRSC